MITSIDKFRQLNENQQADLQQLASEIKRTYPQCRFSIRTSYNTIRIAIISAPIELRLDSSRTNEPVNHYYIKSNYADMPQAQELLQGIADIALRNNREVSHDGDYGSIPNYYVTMTVGEWDKPFTVAGSTVTQLPVESTNEAAMKEHYVLFKGDDVLGGFNTKEEALIAFAQQPKTVNRWREQAQLYKLIKENKIVR